MVLVTILFFRNVPLQIVATATTRITRSISCWESLSVFAQMATEITSTSI